MIPGYWTQATQELAACDQVMLQLIRQFEGDTLTSRGCAFTTLARSIVGQQISVKPPKASGKRLSAQFLTSGRARSLQKNRIYYELADFLQEK